MDFKNPEILNCIKDAKPAAVCVAIEEEERGGPSPEIVEKALAGPEVVEVTPESIKAAFNEKGRRYLFVTERGKYLDTYSMRELWYSPTSLSTFLWDDFPAVEEMGRKVHDVVWDPREAPRAIFERDGIKFYNTFSVPTYTPGGTEQPFRDFVHALFGDRRLADGALVRDWFENFIAWKIQNPWCKGASIALVGPQGCGKSTLLRCIKVLAGVHQVSESSTMESALDGQYHDYKDGKLFALFHEVGSSNTKTYRDKQSVQNNYKEMCDPIGSFNALLNIKSRPQKIGVVICTVMIATNYHDALPLETGERRTMVTGVEMVDRAIIKRVSDAMGAAGEKGCEANIWATYDYYKNREIGDFSGLIAPETEERERMVEGNRTTVDEVSADFLELVEKSGGCYTRDRAEMYGKEKGLSPVEMPHFHRALRTATSPGKTGAFRYRFVGERPKKPTEAISTLAQNMKPEL